jgi:benzoyl-CoA reductase/2-hydroxyglutaryl-CoA dehydratase subunit BcrC/BadD/HgdB
VGEMAEDGKFRIEKFNGQNYQLWNIMEDYLYQKDLFLPLGGISKKLTAMKDEEWEVLERKALGTIRLSLAASMDFNISKENTTKELMDALAKLYEKPSTSNKVFIMKILFNMKMSKGGYVVDHLNEFDMVNNQLSYVKVDFDDEVRDFVILCSFP